MSKRKQQERQANAKQRAYQKKEEEQGRKVVNWIFGVLLLLGVCFLVFSLWLMQ